MSGLFHALAALTLLLLALPLEDARPHAAKATYDHALSTFQKGYLAQSQAEAHLAAEQLRVSDPIWASKFILLEAESMLYRGMDENALGVLRSYAESRPLDAGTVEKLTIEALALSRQRKLELANSRLALAEAACREPSFPSCGDVLAARALLEIKSGNLTAARIGFRSALSFARTHNDSWLEVSTSSNMGYIAMQGDRYDEAVSWFLRAYQNAVQLKNENFMQKIAGNLGWAYYELGDQQRALEQFLTAERSAAQLGNIGSERGWVSTSGYVYRDMEDWLRAEQSYRRALDLARQINSRDDILNALQDLADISVVTDKLAEADSYIKQITSLQAGSGARADPILILTEGKLAIARGQYGQAAKFFHAVRDDPAVLITTKLNAEYQLAILLSLQHQMPAAERMYQATLSAYDAARAQLKNEESQLAFGTNVAQIYDSYIQLLVHEGKTSAALAAADQSRAQTLEHALGSAGAGRSMLTRTVDPRSLAVKTKSTLLFYWLGEKQSYLWAITATKVAFFSLPARQQIAARVESYRKALLDLRDPLESQNTDGQALYQVLIAPAAKLIQPNKPVIILDEGVLSKLNFETLLVPGPVPAPISGSGPISKQSASSSTSLHYLIDDLTLSSAPSLAMLAASKATPGSSQRMLLLGNPVSVDRDFPSLPMFSIEMSRVGRHFASKQVFAGAQATPAAYIESRPEQYAYIHFVSHAVASSTTPLDSAIILSNPSGKEDSYKLYAREIIQHPIQAKLVTISACYGSGTRAYAGEGLVGLSWAFLRAGAHKVIGALWEVSDESTPRLMDSLYQGLADGQSTASALRNAKLALLHSQTQFRAPFYWAPFQIYGRQ
jgi:CHAT domain-containing protein